MACFCVVAAVGAAGLGGEGASAANATVPSAPTITSVKAGLFVITVTFKKPASDGGVPITNYRTQCKSSNGGVTGAQNSNSSPGRAPGLSANKTYTCTVTANNNVGAGTASKPSSPIVAFPRVPGAPKVTSAKAFGLRSITVTFVKPTTDGRAPVTNYRATCKSSNGGITRTQLAPKSPIAVKGLTADKKYTCTVAAANRVGAGKGSAPSSVVVAFPTVPGAPTIKSVKAVGLGSVDIAVTNPANTGGAPITSYRAVCKSGNGGVTNTRVAPGSPIRVGGLTAGKTYTCTVAAANSVRRGPASAASKSVVPRAH